MSAAKTRKAKKTKASKVRRSKPKISEPKLAAKAAAAVRQFRFNAAQTVRIRFAGEKKPENFRVDDMVEASMVTLAGAVKHYYQYRLISNDKAGPGGAGRCYWFFDPQPVGAADPIDPILWRPVAEQPLDGYDIVKDGSGNFSTRSVTSYDGSGSRHVVRLDGKPAGHHRQGRHAGGIAEMSVTAVVEILRGISAHAPAHYLNAMRSVRLSVEAPFFKGSFVAFALFWFRIWCRPTAISKSEASRLASTGTTTV
jgi:hypothetical protein